MIDTHATNALVGENRRRRRRSPITRRIASVVCFSTISTFCFVSVDCFFLSTISSFVEK
jgi:hypothetical protein